MLSPTVLLPTNPALSTVQVLGSVNFAPIGFVFPNDGRDKRSVSVNLQYAWKEIVASAFCVTKPKMRTFL